MDLKIKSTKVEENIVDEKDTIIGKILFDPEDATIYKKFLELVDKITEYEKINKQIGTLGEMPELKAIEDFEKYKGVFDKLDQKLDNYINLKEEIKTVTDEIFGNVSEAFEKVSNSLEPYVELISWASPYFNKKREEKINQYLDNTEEVL